MGSSGSSLSILTQDILEEYTMLTYLTKAEIMKWVDIPLIWFLSRYDYDSLQGILLVEWIIETFPIKTSKRRQIINAKWKYVIRQK